MNREELLQIISKFLPSEDDIKTYQGLQPQTISNHIEHKMIQLGLELTNINKLDNHD